MGSFAAGYADPGRSDRRGWVDVTQDDDGWRVGVGWLVWSDRLVAVVRVAVVAAVKAAVGVEDLSEC